MQEPILILGLTRHFLSYSGARESQFEEWEPLPNSFSHFCMASCVPYTRPDILCQLR
jgi:hypothetical protein